ncbi:DUF4249 domain-containing protein [Flavisericum labens]|uniref:DUF4249 domain-containing protein n=1 Tax=Flavisericum labens TaxID=3377112 RepID=UPI00387A9F5D
MKRILYILSLVLLSTYSCEDVIDVDVETIEPKLVIDASLHWVKGTNGNTQQIRLSLTAPYFSDNIPAASGATVTITDENNNTFNFIEDGSSGVYKTESFLPELNMVYNLYIEYDNEIYTAFTTLTSVAPIEYIEQKNDGGFAGDEIEIKAFYTDPANTENFYLFEFLLFNSNKANLEVYDDVFTDGNQIFAFFSDENIEAGDELIIRNSGITNRAYQFFFILLQQTDDEAGDPFETQPATLRGNCINQTNPENFPLGYFRASETDVFTYEIQ